jgi:hypothetical protein
MNWTWQGVAILGIWMAWLGFEHWLIRRYPKPLIRLKVGENEYEAQNAAAIGALIDAGRGVRS